MTKTEGAEHEAVTNFRRYLRIKSVHPNVNYDECVKFLTEQGKSLGLPVKVHHVLPDKPVVLITFEGKEPSLPSLLLNSHMDVVPVFADKWSHDPFGAEKTENGNIYARGSQDMKCVGIQYLETIRRYVKEGLRFKRTIHISFVPDEEIGGRNGMGIFVKKDAFKDLNVGFSLDEGVANPSNEFPVFYAERTIWHLSVICQGSGGHGSILHGNVAGEKIRYIINKFMDLREKEKLKLNSDPNLTIGDVTTINMIGLSGGVQANVVPPELTVSFDVRVAIDVDHVELAKTFDKWCQEAGTGVCVKYLVKDEKGEITKLDDTNIWWKTFKNQCEKMGLKIKTMIFPGGTDSRFIRALGIPALGFSPMNNTPTLLHDHDEYLNESVFLHGLDIYYNIIQNLANC